MPCNKCCDKYIGHGYQEMKVSAKSQQCQCEIIQALFSNIYTD